MVAALFAGCANTATEETPAPAPAADDPLANLEPITIKLAHGSPATEASTIYCEKWMAAVTEKSGGKIKFDYYPNGQLGSLAELIDALDTGSIDMSKADPSLMTANYPAIGVLNLPFLISTYEQADKVIDGSVGDAIAEELAAASKTQIIGWYVNGFRNFCTKTPITKVADCKGILLRSPEAKVYIDTFTRLDMKPTPIPFGEMYTAMQTGVVDGIETVPQLIAETGYHKLGKYVCKSNHMISLNCITANTDFWAKLPQEYKDIMTECMAENEKEQRAFVASTDEKYYEQIESEGGTITEFENPQELIDLFTPYWSESATAIGGNSQKFIDEIKALK
jgi:tripartite ATP-independent transporter DctP family solute receptor